MPYSPFQHWIGVRLISWWVIVGAILYLSCALGIVCVDSFSLSLSLSLSLSHTRTYTHIHTHTAFRLNICWIYQCGGDVIWWHWVWHCFRQSHWSNQLLFCQPRVSSITTTFSLMYGFTGIPTPLILISLTHSLTHTLTHTHTHTHTHTLTHTFSVLIKPVALQSSPPLLSPP